jgi:hypothetical protein
MEQPEQVPAQAVPDQSRSLFFLQQLVRARKDQAALAARRRNAVRSRLARHHLGPRISTPALIVVFLVCSAGALALGVRGEAQLAAPAATLPTAQPTHLVVQTGSSAAAYRSSASRATSARRQAPDPRVATLQARVVHQARELRADRRFIAALRARLARLEHSPAKRAPHAAPSTGR